MRARKASTDMRERERERERERVRDVEGLPIQRYGYDENRVACGWKQMINACGQLDPLLG